MWNKAEGKGGIELSKVDHISLSTTPVFLYKNEQVVSQGTGFFYARQDTNKSTVLFLVTNYHVLTGFSPAEAKVPIGDNIAFQFHLSDIETGNVKTIRFPLFTKNSKPVWIQSVSFPKADLAIIPIIASLYQECKVSCISSEWGKGNLKIRPTTLVTLVGYPYGYYDRENALPIWKTGSVASEPKVDFEGKPLFLVDVSAFPGMSGSPVFAISYGMYETEKGDTRVGGIRKFLGVYASMEMRKKEKYLEEIIHEAKIGVIDYESLELGHVWKADLILETVKSINVEKYQEEILKNLV